MRCFNQQKVLYTFSASCQHFFAKKSELRKSAVTSGILKQDQGVWGNHCITKAEVIEWFCISAYVRDA